MTEETRPIAGQIIEEAHREAERIVSEWQESRQSREATLRRRVADLEAKEAERTEHERERILSRADARVAMDRRKSSLEIQDSLHREVERRALAEAETHIPQDGRRDLLLAWLVEAGVGLGAGKAVVRCAAADRNAVEAMLPDASRRISAELGTEVSLVMGDDATFSGFGVVLASEDGQTAYSNRFADRLHRRQNGVRQIVHDVLFGE